MNRHARLVLFRSSAWQAGVFKHPLFISPGTQPKNHVAGGFSSNELLYLPTGFFHMDLRCTFLVFGLRPALFFFPRVPVGIRHATTSLGVPRPWAYLISHVARTLAHHLSAIRSFSGPAAAIKAPPGGSPPPPPDPPPKPPPSPPPHPHPPPPPLPPSHPPHVSRFLWLCFFFVRWSDPRVLLLFFLSLAMAKCPDTQRDGPASRSPLPRRFRHDPVVFIRYLSHFFSGAQLLFFPFLCIPPVGVYSHGKPDVP